MVFLQCKQFSDRIRLYKSFYFAPKVLSLANDAAV